LSRRITGGSQFPAWASRPQRRKQILHDPMCVEGAGPSIIRDRAPGRSFDVATISRELESLLPTERRRSSVLIELVPEGRFVTYGIGVPLMDMRSPEVARAVVPVD
jgi:hypothetical protein